jgi:hypothetical protein
MARSESELANILRTKLWKLEWVHQERNHYISTINRNSWVWRVWFGIPPVIKLSECGHGMSA